MHFLKKSILLFSQLWACWGYSQNSLAGHHQLLIVTTQDWEEKQGELFLFERASDHSAWILTHPSIPVVLGKNGLGWGIGLYSLRESEGPYKKEGDGKSPAGIFSLGSAFGFAPSSEMEGLKIDYLPLHEFIEAVDDPLSLHYNCIVDRRETIPDWCSSEKMYTESLYAMGVIVHHNFPHPKPYAGSAIFFHIWRDKNSGTAGCTAMSQENLNHVLFWLDQNKSPALVQLPVHQYYELQNVWKLPTLISK